MKCSTTWTAGALYLSARAGWWAPGMEKTCQWKKTSGQSYQHLLCPTLHIWNTVIFFLRTLFYLKLCFLRTLIRIVWIQNAQFKLGKLVDAKDSSWHLFCRVGNSTLPEKTVIQIAVGWLWLYNPYGQHHNVHFS